MVNSASATKKREILQATTFGKPTAEEEGNLLSAYFVETDQWQSIYAGDIDVVYGPKGAGKSALYALLLSRTSDLFDRGIIIVAAENPRGAVAFRDLVANPPANEAEFRNLWKLFFLVLVAHTLRDYGISPPKLREVIAHLEEARLLPRNVSLRALLQTAFSYVRRVMRADSMALETTLEFNPVSSLPSGVTGRIRFLEPSSLEESLGWVSVDHLLGLANTALEESEFRVWLVLDRLDVAFAESAELESNALRALFRVYLDLRKFSAISLKIFLRTDIWMNILKSGFREASHISSQMTISWDEASLMNLVIRRAVHNRAVREFYAIDAEEIMSDRSKQVTTFYRIFPRKIQSTEPLRTFEWILQNTSDGSRRNSPREVIHLLSAARQLQLRRFEVGQTPPDGDILFDAASLTGALPEVSRMRFQQTLCAEYPHLRDRMYQLENEKSSQTAQTLAIIWRMDLQHSLEIAYQLVDIGFFQFSGTRRSPVFSIPLLFQSALKIRRGH
jgi:hypothetical protein